MDVWPWVISGTLLLAILLLSGKMYLFRKSVRELKEQVSDWLMADTNTLLTISTRDRELQRLTESINRQLRLLRREQQRFRQGDAELKEAITNVSHDLRTPLTAICGYLDLLEQEHAEADAQRYLARIRERTEVLCQLTEELFRYSVVTSVQEEHLELLSLNGVLEESLASYYPALRQKNIEPLILIPETRVERSLNRSALLRIFGNLIGNVLKYSDGDLEIKLDVDGTVAFTNTASGLTAVDVGRLFDRFYTVESGRDSTGLGLSIARLLTERLGGTISAAYHEQRLTITLLFP